MSDSTGYSPLHEGEESAGDSSYEGQDDDDESSYDGHDVGNEDDDDDSDYEGNEEEEDDDDDSEYEGDEKEKDDGSLSEEEDEEDLERRQERKRRIDNLKHVALTIPECFTGQAKEKVTPFFIDIQTVNQSRLEQLRKMCFQNTQIVLRWFNEKMATSIPLIRLDDLKGHLPNVFILVFKITPESQTHHVAVCETIDEISGFRTDVSILESTSVLVYEPHGGVYPVVSERLAALGYQTRAWCETNRGPQSLITPSQHGREVVMSGDDGEDCAIWAFIVLFLIKRRVTPLLTYIQDLQVIENGIWSLKIYVMCRLVNLGGLPKFPKSSAGAERRQTVFLTGTIGSKDCLSSYRLSSTGSSWKPLTVPKVKKRTDARLYVVRHTSEKEFCVKVETVAEILVKAITVRESRGSRIQVYTVCRKDLYTKVCEQLLNTKEEVGLMNDDVWPVDCKTIRNEKSIFFEISRALQTILHTTMLYKGNPRSILVLHVFRQDQVPKSALYPLHVGVCEGRKGLEIDTSHRRPWFPKIKLAKKDKQDSIHKILFYSRIKYVLPQSSISAADICWKEGRSLQDVWDKQKHTTVQGIKKMVKLLQNVTNKNILEQDVDNILTIQSKLIRLATRVSPKQYTETYEAVQSKMTEAIKSNKTKVLEVMRTIRRAHSAAVWDFCEELGLWEYFTRDELLTEVTEKIYKSHNADPSKYTGKRMVALLALCKFDNSSVS